MTDSLNGREDSGAVTCSTENRRHLIRDDPDGSFRKTLDEEKKQWGAMQRKCDRRKRRIARMELGLEPESDIDDDENRLSGQFK